MIGIWAVFVHFYRALKLGFTEPEFRGLLYLVSVVIGSGTVFYRFVEDWTWVDAFYFTVITLTTVGYGDITPSQTLSKLFTVMLVLLGIGLLVALIERVARYAVTDHEQRRRT